MPDTEYPSLSEAITNAPAAPQASVWETIIVGTAADRLTTIRGYIAQATTAGLQVEIVASPDTLKSASLQGRNKLDGARIVEGSTPTFDLIRFKFHQ
jgi:hypothetical protein